jgi:hypothetical protein
MLYYVDVFYSTVFCFTPARTERYVRAGKTAKTRRDAKRCLNLFRIIIQSIFTIEDTFFQFFPALDVFFAPLRVLAALRETKHRIKLSSNKIESKCCVIYKKKDCGAVQYL